MASFNYAPTARLSFLCRMLKDNDTGRHRGHAFCDYENVAQANVAIEKLNGYEIEGRKLRVKFANEGKSGSGRGSNVSRSVFVYLRAQ
jgi:RNA recognition motif-containing protein